MGAGAVSAIEDAVPKAISSNVVITILRIVFFMFFLLVVNFWF
jgi:hypothetical protein